MKTFRPAIALVAFALLAALPARAAEKAGTFKFDERTFEVSESAGMAHITVERSHGQSGAVTVDYATSDGTAMAGSDYEATSGTLSWDDGDEGSRTFDVPIIDDTMAEGAETIVLTLSNPTGGADIDGSRGSAVVRIAASDQSGAGGGDGEDDGEGGDDHGNDHGHHGNAAGTFHFDQRNFVAREASGMATISVERSGGESGAVSVDYATSDKKAIAGSDYEATSGTLSWDDGDDSRKTFQIPIINDNVPESAENLRITLSNATGGAEVDQARGWAYLTILDDDQGSHGDDENQPGTLEFTQETFQALEGDGMATISVKRHDGSKGMVSVEYSTADDTAMAGSDYTATSGVLSWDDGDTSVKTFDVPILEDDLTEGNETVQLALANPTGGASLDDESTAELLILDNDGATSCTADDTTLCLLDNRFQVKIVWRTSDGNSGDGHVIPQSDASGLVWFFDESNIEMLIKVLDACDLPGFETYWVFFAATTNVDFTVTVTDTTTGVTKEYTNPGGDAAEPIQDTVSFDTCQ